MCFVCAYVGVCLVKYALLHGLGLLCVLFVCVMVCGWLNAHCCMVWGFLCVLFVRMLVCFFSLMRGVASLFCSVCFVCVYVGVCWVKCALLHGLCFCVFCVCMLVCVFG